MTCAIGLMLPILRQHRALSQEALSRLVGVPRVILVKWENGHRPVPQRHLPALSLALRIPEAELVALLDPALNGHGPPVGMWSTDSSQPERPRYEGIDKAPLSDMLALGTVARGVQGSALLHLEAGRYRFFCTLFPRDTKHELLLAHHPLANGACLWRTSPRQLGYGKIILSGEEESDWVYAGDCLQPALLWQSDKELLVMFGQVTLGVRLQGRRYRVDFLLLYRGPDRKPHWMYLELDGDFHRETANQDARRAEGIGLPEIRFENVALLRPGFFHDRLLPEIRNKARFLEKRAEGRKPRGAGAA